MKAEKKALRISILINIIVATIKLVGGVIWNTFALTIDGIYTISDLVTDVIAILGIKVGKKRANKNHPYGYGRVFYIIELFMGLIAFFIGVFVIILSFSVKDQKPSIFVIFLIIIAVLLKLGSANHLLKIGRKENSDLLIASGYESKLEAYSSLGLIIIIILSQFIPKIDMIGGILIALLLIFQSFRTIRQNILLLIGVTYDDLKVRDKIKKVVDKYRVIDIVDVAIIKDGPYYQLTLTFKAKKDMKVGSLLRIQNKIKKELKAKNVGFKFIEFHLT